MYAESTLFIIEYLWSRQSREASTFCLNSISIYFTLMMGRNSAKLYLKSGLKTANEFDNIGLSDSIIECTA